jgi:hypothetical protein
MIVEVQLISKFRVKISTRTRRGYLKFSKHLFCRRCLLNWYLLYGRPAFYTRITKSNLITVNSTNWKLLRRSSFQLISKPHFFWQRRLLAFRIDSNMGIHPLSAVLGCLRTYCTVTCGVIAHIELIFLWIWNTITCACRSGRPSRTLVQIPPSSSVSSYDQRVALWVLSSKICIQSQLLWCMKIWQ